MRSTPSSTARRSTRIASSWSRGGPHTPGPGSCIAPNPRRWTVRSPPRVRVPLAVAGRSVDEAIGGPPGRAGRRVQSYQGVPRGSGRLGGVAQPAGRHPLTHPAEDVGAPQRPALVGRDAPEDVDLEGAVEVVAQGGAVAPPGLRVLAEGVGEQGEGEVVGTGAVVAPGEAVRRLPDDVDERAPAVDAHLVPAVLPPEAAAIDALSRAGSVLALRRRLHGRPTLLANMRSSQPPPALEDGGQLALDELDEGERLAQPPPRRGAGAERGDALAQPVLPALHLLLTPDGALVPDVVLHPVEVASRPGRALPADQVEGDQVADRAGDRGGAGAQLLAEPGGGEPAGVGGEHGGEDPRGHARDPGVGEDGGEALHEAGHRLGVARSELVRKI